MIGIPEDINLGILPGPKREAYSHDEIIWSPDGTSFVLAYSITEISNNNPVGMFIWGSSDGQGRRSRILGCSEMLIFAPKEFARWHNDKVFVVRTSFKHRIFGYIYPLIVIHVSDGFAVIKGSHSYDIQRLDMNEPPAVLLPYTYENLQHELNAYVLTRKTNPIRQWLRDRLV